MRRQRTIGVIANREGSDSQALLSRAATTWRMAGVKVAGVLAEEDGDAVCAAGFLCVIGSGKRFSIQLDAVPAGTSCHLDSRGVEAACAEVLPLIATADVVILSKFGKLEAMRQGLWPAFERALAAGRPLLTTVSPKHAEAWRGFAPDAEWLQPAEGSIRQWWAVAGGGSARAS